MLLRHSHPQKVIDDLVDTLEAHAQYHHRCLHPLTIPWQDCHEGTCSNARAAIERAEKAAYETDDNH